MDSMWYYININAIVIMITMFFSGNLQKKIERLREEWQPIFIVEHSRALTNLRSLIRISVRDTENEATCLPKVRN